MLIRIAVDPKHTDISIYLFSISKLLFYTNYLHGHIIRNKLDGAVVGLEDGLHEVLESGCTVSSFEAEGCRLALKN